MEVEQAFETPLFVYDREKGISSRFQQVQRAHGQFPAANRQRIARHALAGCRSSHQIFLGSEQPPEVAVGDDAHELLSLLDDPVLNNPILDNPVFDDPALNNHSHPESLARHLLDGLGELDDVTVWGITDPARFDERVASVAITHASSAMQ